MNIEELNSLAVPDLEKKLLQCCGSSFWVKRLIQARPFLHPGDLFFKADEAWDKTTEKDRLEAFSHHPKIGDLKSIEKKYASTKVFAKEEQASVNTAAPVILEQLANGNSLYEKKFGFILIVCATGKKAGEMLSLLEERLKNDRPAELRIASAEQNKITKLRLQKLLS